MSMGEMNTEQMVRDRLALDLERIKFRKSIMDLESAFDINTAELQQKVSEQEPLLIERLRVGNVVVDGYVASLVVKHVNEGKHYKYGELYKATIAMVKSLGFLSAAKMIQDLKTNKEYVTVTPASDVPNVVIKRCDPSISLK